MAVIVSFATPRGIGAVDAPGIGAVRLREDLGITDPAATTGAALDGEVAVVANGEASIIAVAFGTTPDATATAATAATSAGFGVPAGAVVLIPVKAGAKIGVAAIQ